MNKAQQGSSRPSPDMDQELIIVLTQLFAVRAVAGQQEEVILTGVRVQQRAVVQAKVNN